MNLGGGLYNAYQSSGACTLDVGASDTLRCFDEMVLSRTTTLFGVGEDVRNLSQKLCNRVVMGVPMCNEHPCWTNLGRTCTLEITWSIILSCVIGGHICIVGTPILGKQLPIVTSDYVGATSG